MTATSLLTGWVAAGVVVFFLLIFGATWFRRHRPHRPMHYPKLRVVDRAIRWPRILLFAVGLYAAIRLATAAEHYPAILIAPSVWAIIVIVGRVGLDLLVLGRRNTPRELRPQVRAASCLPWRLLVLIVLMTGALGYAVYWAAGQSMADGRSHFYGWTIGNTSTWGVWTPFPGPFYTAGLPYWLPWVFGLAIAGTVLVLLRRPYLPEPRYAALDASLRRRTIHDLWLAVLGAVSATLGMMGLDVAAAFAMLGPGSTQRALVAAIASVLGLWSLGLVFWVTSNLLVLPVVEELRSPQATKPAKPEKPVRTKAAEAPADADEPSPVRPVEVPTPVLPEPAPTTAPAEPPDVIEPTPTPAEPEPEAAPAVSEPEPSPTEPEPEAAPAEPVPPVSPAPPAPAAVRPPAKLVRSAKPTPPAEPVPPAEPAVEEIVENPAPGEDVASGTPAEAKDESGASRDSEATPRPAEDQPAEAPPKPRRKPRPRPTATRVPAVPPAEESPVPDGKSSPTTADEATQQRPVTVPRAKRPRKTVVPSPAGHESAPSPAESDQAEPTVPEESSSAPKKARTRSATLTSG